MSITAHQISGPCQANIVLMHFYSIDTANMDKYQKMIFVVVICIFFKKKCLQFPLSLSFVLCFVLICVPENRPAHQSLFRIVDFRM
jgi:hypothetical protein